MLTTGPGGTEESREVVGGADGGSVGGADGGSVGGADGGSVGGEVDKGRVSAAASGDGETAEESSASPKI